MSDSVLDRIRQNRNRTRVPQRDDVLVTKSPSNEPGSQLDNPDERETTKEDTEDTTATDATLEELKAQLAKFPLTRRHSAIVLDQDIDQELTRFCKDQGVTVEVFLEAAWLFTSAEPELMKVTMAEAKRRYKARKQAGKLRRLITMLKERT
jgi:hypothetical protein